MVSDKLKKYRESTLKVSQEELAKIINMSQATIANCENGAMKFLPNQLIKFLISKGVNLNDLYNDEISVHGFISGINKPAVMERPPASASNRECQECKTKEKFIELLMDENKRLKSQLAEGKTDV